MISIVVPIYNGEKYLERCLNSLESQTFLELEFLLVDDGSTDRSAEICKYFCSIDKRFKYIYQDNSGVSMARNKGIECASGDYLGFCDSDDFVEPDLYEFLYKLITENGSAIAVCGYYLDNSAAHVIRGVENEKVFADSQKAIELTLKDNVYGGFLWNKLFDLSKTGKFFLDNEMHLYEDLLLMCELYNKCNNIVFCNVPKYHYVQNSESAINGVFRDKDWSGLTAYKKILEIVENNNILVLDLAKRNFLEITLRLADKLVYAGKLNKENYKILKHELYPYKNEYKLMSYKRKVAFKIFYFSRKLYGLIRKMKK